MKQGSNNYNLEERTAKFGELIEEILTYWKEAQELTLIFQKITSTLRNK